MSAGRGEKKKNLISPLPLLTNTPSPSLFSECTADRSGHDFYTRGGGPRKGRGCACAQSSPRPSLAGTLAVLRKT